MANSYALVRGARGDSEVIEEALRHELGFDLLERLCQHDGLSEEEAVAVAVEAQHKAGRRRRWVRAALAALSIGLLTSLVLAVG